MVNMCTETHWVGLGPSKRNFRGLARVLGDRVFLLKFVFTCVPKPIGRAWALPNSIFEIHFRGLARVLGAGDFLFKLVFKSIPKLIWRA